MCKVRHILFVVLVVIVVLSCIRANIIVDDEGRRRKGRGELWSCRARSLTSLSVLLWPTDFETRVSASPGAASQRICQFSSSSSLSLFPYLTPSPLLTLLLSLSLSLASFYPSSKSLVVTFSSLSCDRGPEIFSPHSPPPRPQTHSILCLSHGKVPETEEKQLRDKREGERSED